MKHLQIKYLWISLILIIGSRAWSRSAGSIATNNFGQVTALTASILQGVQPQELLVVFDIDNTLLRLREDFGSEHWFMWQRDLVERKLAQLPSVTDSVDNLLTIQSWIYNEYPMEPVDLETPFWIQSLRDQGASVITLTSRSLAVHRTTLREIKRNRILLSNGSDLGFVGEGDSYQPYSLDWPERSGLSKEDIVQFKLGQARPVVFDQGVFLTQGQHKGVMLKTLLARINKRFKAIVFIDDRKSHVEAMNAMAVGIPQDVYSVHYYQSENWTLPFLAGRTQAAQQDWCEFSNRVDRAWIYRAEPKIYRSCGTR